MDKENIVYQQRFQNAFKTVDLVVYSKPKSSLGLEKRPSKFVRKCLAKEKLKSLQKEVTCKEIGMDTVKKNMSIPKNIKPIGLLHEEKRSKSRTYPVANQVTWGELLHQQKDSSAISNNNEFPQSDKAFPNCARTNKWVEKQKNDSKLNYIISSAAGHARPQIYPLTKEMSKPRNEIDNNIKVVNNINSRKLKRKSDNSDVLHGDESAVTNNREFHNGSKTSNKISTIDKMNRAQSDQTHSPFGESAIQLLHQLQERLKSHGDDEGFNMVSAIGAYFKTKKGENDSPTSLYPTVFSTPNPVNLERLVEKEQQMKIAELQQIVNEQGERIHAQASVIQELRDLSTKLIEYHEQLSSKSDEDKAKILSDKVADVNCDVKDNNDEEMVTKLTNENQTLRKKLRSQLDFILNLELERTNLRRQLKNADSLNQINRTEKISIANIEQKPSREESEVDSAFDEKIGSRSASGTSSVTYATSNCKSLSVPRGLRPKSPSVLKSCSLNKDEEPKCLVDNSVLKFINKNSWSISAPIFKELNSFHVEGVENDTLKGKESDSLSFISDLTSYSNFTNKHHSSLRNDDNVKIIDNFSTIGNDKFLPALRYQYLESTHVDKGQKTGRFSPSLSRPLNEIEMYSGDDSDETRVKPIFASVSCDNY